MNNYKVLSDGEQANAYSACGGPAMRRRIAVVGDNLWPGGGKIAGYSGRPAFFHGHQPALIGGEAYCEACKSIGAIAKAGGPRRMLFMGEIALDGDIVMCRCATPPRIVATLAGETWYEDMGEDSGEVVAASGLARRQETYDEMPVAMAPSGPVAGYPYFVETSDGRGLFGYTDEQGELPRITTISAGSLTIYWGDEALAKQPGGENA
ncbi:PAAR domain-containing protein [Cupriavidus sp. BIS7]|uniref:PAAR domain-containing protein n=1 Tax=Cupriavidus sp. BIS7 TaxID=1217718 RepID=UPI0032AF7CC5